MPPEIVDTLLEFCGAEFENFAFDDVEDSVNDAFDACVRERETQAPRLQMSCYYRDTVSYHCRTILRSFLTDAVPGVAQVVLTNDVLRAGCAMRVLRSIAFPWQEMQEFDECCLRRAVAEKRAARESERMLTMSLRRAGVPRNTARYWILKDDASLWRC